LNSVLGSPGGTNLIPPGVAAGDVAAVRAIMAGPLPRARAMTMAARSDATRVEAALNLRTTGLANLAGLLAAEIRNLFVVFGTTITDAKTNSNVYIAMDAGILYGFRIGVATPYIGANIYFRPVNKDASFADADSPGRRLSLTFGITTQSIEEDQGSVAAADKTRFDLVTGNKSLVLGLGARVTRTLRLSGGVLAFKERDPNPLIAKRSVAVVPYMSFSLDIDIAKGLSGDLGGMFGGGKGAASSEAR
jgi:hypothetical protein